MRFGLDYSWGRPSLDAMKRAGVEFVCRYVSTPGNGKNLTKPEADVLRGAGLDIVVVFETTTGRALAGYAAGSHDARSAERQALNCGMPSGSPIYFAVDFDAQESQQGGINRYFRGVTDVLGKHRAGVYAGYWVVKRMLDVGVCRYAWQTYAWSGGKWDERAQLRQYDNGERVGGAWVDFNHAMTDDFGQWREEKPEPKPKRAAWFAAWALWRLAGRRWKRPSSAPKRVPAWAWRRLAAIRELVEQGRP